MNQNTIEKILDENNDENVILYDNDDNEIEFEQIALIPLDEDIYVILHPVDELDGIGNDEALVFKVDEENKENGLEIVTNPKIIDKVFDEYYKLIQED